MESTGKAWVYIGNRKGSKKVLYSSKSACSFSFEESLNNSEKDPFFSVLLKLLFSSVQEAKINPFGSEQMPEKYCRSFSVAEEKSRLHVSMKMTFCSSTRGNRISGFSFLTAPNGRYFMTMD
ncbi:hypothetical protein D3C86_1197530 [compost metagenome]